MVAPVVLVQDLTKGPYQAGVTPAAGTINWIVPTIGTSTSTVILMLNDKLGSITPILGNQFDGRSFSVTWMEFQNATVAGSVEAFPDLILRLLKRSDVVAAGTPTAATGLFEIQDNDGTKRVPVEIFTFDNGPSQGSNIWRGLMGDNINTLGSRRTIEPEPNVTIGPDDALVLIANSDPSSTDQTIRVSFRGFYQEQPS